MRVVCFDLDDTLVAEADYVESGLLAVGAALASRHSLRCRDPGQWLVDRWRETRGGGVIQELLDDEGIPRDPLGAELVEVYRLHEPRIALRPGARELLQHLDRTGDRLALVSDGYAATQRRKWEAIRVDVPFHPVVFTDEIGRAFWKPHPCAFERVMAAWPDAGSFTYVGDNPAKDFLAPNQLGWRTIEFAHPGNIRPRGSRGVPGAAHLVVEGFDQLKEAL
jgi:putative hydrolase of the HAD superfamily